MAIPLTASQKDVFEDKLAEAEDEIRKIRLLAQANDSGNDTAVATAVTAAKAALDAAQAQVDA